MCVCHVRETKVAGARVTMMAAYLISSRSRARGGLKTPRRVRPSTGTVGKLRQASTDAAAVYAQISHRPPLGRLNGHPSLARALCAYIRSSRPTWRVVWVSVRAGALRWSGGVAARWCARERLVLGVGVAPIGSRYLL
jgi:hypothetical protein